MSNQSTTVHTGDIGFKLSNGRLPWSTLEGDLQKRGYTIFDWLHGVDRDREKGISGLSAEGAYKLYDALFVDDDRIRFVRCEGELPRIYSATSFSTVCQNLRVTTMGLHHYPLCRARADLA